MVPVLIGLGVAALVGAAIVIALMVDYRVTPNNLEGALRSSSELEEKIQTAWRNGNYATARVLNRDGDETTLELNNGEERVKIELTSDGCSLREGQKLYI